MDKDWDWKEFGIEYDEGAEDIDEPLAGLNGDGEIFALGLTDTSADSESTAASKLCYYKYSKCCYKSTTICVNFAAIAVSLIIYICTVMLQLL